MPGGHASFFNVQQIKISSLPTLSELYVVVFAGGGRQDTIHQLLLKAVSVSF